MILVSDEPDLAASRARIDNIWKVAMEGALETGASIAHHHGAGMARAPYVRRALGSGHEVLARIKAALAPKGILNPGKLGFDKD
jgi:alkyldihydroxyacetonephosphate synthase